jgi:hypothetical protein
LICVITVIDYHINHNNHTNQINHSGALSEAEVFRQLIIGGQMYANSN